MNGKRGPSRLSGFADRQSQSQIVESCPVCGLPATVETLEVIRSGERYKQTLYRCENAAPPKPRLLAGKPKSRPNHHPIYRTETRIAEMPRLSPEKTAEIKARIEALPISKVAFSKELGKSSNYINTVLCSGNVSPEGLALIEKKIAYLENANSRFASEPEPAHQAEPAQRPEPAKTEENAEPAAPEPECKPKLTIGKVKFEIRELESDTSPYFLASQIEAMVKKLGPHDPDWLLLRAALVRGGVEL